MPPLLALILTFFLIAYLFWREGNRDYKPSVALWIPAIWLLILVATIAVGLAEK